MSRHGETTGEPFISGYFRSKNYHIQRSRVRASINRVEPSNTAIRRGALLKRRTYYVPQPNSLRHIDDNHALILLSLGAWAKQLYCWIFQDGVMFLGVFVSTFTTTSTQGRKQTFQMSKFLSSYFAYTQFLQKKSLTHNRNLKKCLKIITFQQKKGGQLIKYG